MTMLKYAAAYTLPLTMNVPHVLGKVIRTIADRITPRNTAWVRTRREMDVLEMTDQ